MVCEREVRGRDMGKGCMISRMAFKYDLFYSGSYVDTARLEAGLPGEFEMMEFLVTKASLMWHLVRCLHERGERWSV